MGRFSQSLFAVALLATAPHVALSDNRAGDHPKEALALEVRNGCLLVVPRLRDLAEESAWFDVHNLAEVSTTLCENPSPEFLIWNAIALFKLDEPARAKRLLKLAQAQPSTKDRATVVSSWMTLRLGGRPTYAGVKPLAQKRLAAIASIGKEDEFLESAAGLPDSVRVRAISGHSRYLDARKKSPFLAGALSALLPGAGQVYNGSFESAAVAFALNAVLIGATVELARKDLPFAATTTGLAASVFYVGNILNAADLSSRKNDRASSRFREEVERVLLPEVFEP